MRLGESQIYGDHKQLDLQSSSDFAKPDGTKVGAVLLLYRTIVVAEMERL